MVQHSNNATRQSRSMVLWVLALLWIGAGLWANAQYHALAWGLRATAGLFWVAGWVGLLAYTTQGRALSRFLVVVRGELRKVVWPTREETVRSTIMVMLMVVVASLMLWGLDAVLMWAFGHLAGQGVS